jgi:hypothetical protein
VRSPALIRGIVVAALLLAVGSLVIVAVTIGRDDQPDDLRNWLTNWFIVFSTFGALAGMAGATIGSAFAFVGGHREPADGHVARQVLRAALTVWSSAMFVLALLASTEGIGIGAWGAALFWLPGLLLLGIPLLVLDRRHGDSV